MLPANLLLDGVVDHSIYNERRVPQLAAMTVFREEQRLWRAQAVLTVRGSADEPAMCRKLTSMYGDFGVGLLVLSPEMIDSGYLKADEFDCRLKQALFSDTQLTPPPSTPVSHVAAA